MWRTHSKRASAPPNGYAADGMLWAVNLKSKRTPNRENEDWLQTGLVGGRDRPRFQTEHRCAYPRAA